MSAAALTAGVVAAALAVAVPSTRDDASTLPLLLLVAAAGLSFVAVGQMASAKRPGSRVGLLMTLTGFLYLTPQVAAGSFEVSRVAAWLYLPVLAHLFLSFPSGRLRSRLDSALAVAAYVFAPAAALLSTAPFDRGELSVALDTTLQAVGCLLAILVAIAVARHFRRASRPVRRSLTPLLWAAGVNLAAFLVATVAEVADPDRALPPALAALRPAALLLMPLAFLTSPLRSSNGALLGVDPRHDAHPAALVHDASLLEEPLLVNAVAGAARLALDNRRLRGEISLSREIPAGLAERLLRVGRRIGETETLEVLMSDVRGYSTIAEPADPHSLARQLDEHRKEMSRVVAEQGGTEMQFIGDAAFAVFGAPLPAGDHAERAVLAASAMQCAQASVNERWTARGLPRFDLSIGLSTGVVAAALLQWAEGGQTVLSERTYAAVDGSFEAEPIEPATVKGRKALVTAYRMPAPA